MFKPDTAFVLAQGFPCFTPLATDVVLICNSDTLSFLRMGPVPERLRYFFSHKNVQTEKNLVKKQCNLDKMSCKTAGFWEISLVIAIGERVLLPDLEKEGKDHCVSLAFYLGAVIQVETNFLESCVVSDSRKLNFPLNQNGREWMHVIIFSSVVLSLVNMRPESSKTAGS